MTDATPRDGITSEQLYETAIDEWGEDVQLDMLGEECSELSAEVSRFMRGRSDEDDLAEEIVDVQIMIEQARMIVDDCTLQDARVAKLNRLRERLEEAGADV